MVSAFDGECFLKGDGDRLCGLSIEYLWLMDHVGFEFFVQISLFRKKIQELFVSHCRICMHM